MNAYEEQDYQDELGARLGDGRRCPRHGIVIGSPDGLFDGVCGACEFANEEEFNIDTEYEAFWAGVEMGAAS